MQLERQPIDRGHQREASSAADGSVVCGCSSWCADAFDDASWLLLFLVRHALTGIDLDQGASAHPLHLVFFSG